MQRGKNQVLFKYLPGKPIDYNPGIARIVKWWSNAVENVNKQRILNEIYKEVKNFKHNHNFPGTIDPKMFSLLTPRRIEAELFPLTFICENCSRAYTVGTPKQMLMKKCKCDECGGSLYQMDLVYTHECGNLWGPRIPRCTEHGYTIKLDNYGSNSPKDWRWKCSTCKKEVATLNNMCDKCDEGKRVYPKPFAQGSVFVPQTLTLVNVQNINENKLSEDLIFKKLIIADYLGLIKNNKCTLEELLSVNTEQDKKEEEMIKNFKSQGFSEEDISRIIGTLQKINPDKRDIRNKVLYEVGALVKPPNGDMTELALKTYEFMETLKSSSAKHLTQIIEGAKRRSHPNLSKIEKFPSRMKSIGVENAYVLNDLSILKVVYGFTRGMKEKERDKENSKIRLNRFPPDLNDESKIPIYLNKYNTEAILLEFDRWKILKWLQENGYVNSIPDKNDEAGLKAWFLNNVDHYNISQFDEIDKDASITKVIYKLLHSITHSLIITGSVECGLDKNSIAELIMPSIPAIIMYSNNIQEFQTGGMFTLFENNIYPWVDKTIEKVKSCIYDPVCMDYQCACHACIHLSEISCIHFNYDLGRDVLIGKKHSSGNIIGFWSKDFIDRVSNISND